MHAGRAADLSRGHSKQQSVSILPVAAPGMPPPLLLLAVVVALRQASQGVQSQGAPPFPLLEQQRDACRATALGLRVCSQPAAQAGKVLLLQQQPDACKAAALIQGSKWLGGNTARGPCLCSNKMMPAGQQQQYWTKIPG